MTAMPAPKLTRTDQTRLAHVGRQRGAAYVNPPVVRASTVLAQSLSDWRRRASLPASGKPVDNYARFGTPTTQAFEQAITELEGAHRSICFPSGLAACTHALMAVARPGAHILCTASVYWPVRAFVSETLTRLGIEVEYIDGLDAAALASRIRPETVAVYLESPGSVTFEVLAVDAIAAEAHRAGLVVILDNTWATSVLFKPLAHGVDISIQSATKYICGHSDTVLGVAACSEQGWQLLSRSAVSFGQTASPDDLYQGLRGLRTLGVRLAQHGESATRLAHWLTARPEVLAVFSPVLADHPGHADWRRLYQGASGLFSFVLGCDEECRLDAFFQSLRVFGIGLSWGGFESLLVPLPMPEVAATRGLAGAGQLIRLHAGLEACDDLIDDLERAFVALADTPASAAVRGPAVAAAEAADQAGQAGLDWQV